MENSKLVNQLYDAVDLVKLMEHIADGQQHGVARQSEVPWAGIRLTLAQTRDLISAALDEAQTGESETATGPRTVTKGRRRDDRRDVETIVNPGAVDYSAETGTRSSSLVREIVDGNSSGTFNRLQLPRESSASGEVL